MNILKKQGLLRKLLGAIGAILASKGVIDASLVETGSGIVIALITLLQSATAIEKKGLEVLWGPLRNLGNMVGAGLVSWGVLASGDATLWAELGGAVMSVIATTLSVRAPEKGGSRATRALVEIAEKLSPL